VRKGLKWCQLSCLNPDCNANQAMAPSENWIQTCNATLLTQTFMCSGRCGTEPEAEFGKRLECKKSACGYIKGEADADTRSKFACKYREFCRYTKRAEPRTKLYCNRILKHPNVRKVQGKAGGGNFPLVELS
jgi:hypothetical protein